MLKLLVEQSHLEEHSLLNMEQAPPVPVNVDLGNTDTVVMFSLPFLSHCFLFLQLPEKPGHNVSVKACHRPCTLCLMISFPVLLPINGSPSVHRLNKDAIHPHADTRWYPRIPDTVTEVEAAGDPAYHVRVPAPSSVTSSGNVLSGTELERIMLVGIVIGYKTPDTSSLPASTGSRAATATMPNKKIRTMIPTNSKILQLADCRPGNSVFFALLFTGSSSLARSTGHSALAKEIKLGDVLGVYEPLPTEKFLGEHTPLFEDWNHIVVFRNDIQVPLKPIVKSGASNQQVTFVACNLRVAFSRASVITSGRVPCIGVTCDRQDVRCRGCITGNSIRKNVVIHVTVQVLNQPRYNEATQVATFHLRSYALSELFVDMRSLEAFDYDDMPELNAPIRTAVRNIQDRVNNNGGWTLYGWHRMGVKRSLEDDAFEVNLDTGGHATRLEPTNTSAPFRQQLLDLRYCHSMDG